MKPNTTPVDMASEPVMARPMTSYNDVMGYLHSIRISWDGYGAEKISYQVVSNLRQVLLISDDKDWENWMISPASNGTLGLQSKLNVASISVGDEEYSYYSCRDGREDWGDFVPFSPSGFLEVMRRIV